MIPVAESKGISIHSPNDGIIGFQTSPYPVHVQGGAVDIFSRKPFGSHTQSPVTGEVIYIDKSRVGIARHFKSKPHDYIIVIKNKDFCVRILHIKPEVEVGMKINVGDKIGKFLRTPLLPFWSYPHIHAEIKDCKDKVTPLNAFSLEILGTGEFVGDPENEFEYIEGDITSVTENFIIVTPKIDVFGRTGNFHGVIVNVGDEFALLDAQCPWNCYGGLVLMEDSKVKVGQKVKFGNIYLGQVIKSLGSLATYSLGGDLGDGVDRYSKGLLYKDVKRFNVPYKRIKVNGEVFLGISTGLSLKENRTIKLVPEKPLVGSYEEGQEVEINFI